MREPGQLGRRIAKGAAWIAVARWANLVISLGVVIVIARLLGPDIWGVYAGAMIPILVFHPLFEGALSEALIRRRDLEPGHVDAGFWLGMALAAIAAAICVFAAAPLAGLINAPGAAELLAPLAATLFVSTASVVPESLLARDMRHKQAALADIASNAVGSAVGLFAALGGEGVWSLVYMEAARVSVRLVWVMFAARWRPGIAVRSRHVRELAGLNALGAALRLTAAIDRVVPRMAIGAVLGQAALGQFALAWRLYDQISTLFVGPMNAMSFPATARIKDDKAALRTFLISATRLASLVSYPAFIGLAIVAPVLIPLAFGPEWVTAATAVQVLSLLGLRAAVSSFTGGLLRGADRAAWFLGASLFGVLVLAILAPLAAPYGVAAVAAAMVVRSIIQWPVSLALVTRVTGVSAADLGRAAGAAMAASFVMGAMVFTVDHAFLNSWPAIPRLCAMVATGGLTYFAALAVLDRPAILAVWRAAMAARLGDKQGFAAALRTLAKT